MVTTLLKWLSGHKNKNVLTSIPASAGQHIKQVTDRQMDRQTSDPIVSAYLCWQPREGSPPTAVCNTNAFVYFNNKITDYIMEPPHRLF